MKLPAPKEIEEMILILEECIAELKQCQIHTAIVLKESSFKKARNLFFQAEVFTRDEKNKELGNQAQSIESAEA
jgi:hypothetical protein